MKKIFNFGLLFDKKTQKKDYRLFKVSEFKNFIDV